MVDPVDIISSMRYIVDFLSILELCILKAQTRFWDLSLAERWLCWGVYLLRFTSLLLTGIPLIFDKVCAIFSDW